MTALFHRMLTVLFTYVISSGCGSQSTPIGDAGRDAEEDTDVTVNSDADVDDEPAPDGDVRSDADVPSVDWTWTSIEIPNELDGDYLSASIWAVANDDVVLCTCDPVDETGGMGRFDGVGFSSEVTSVCCNFLFGINVDQVWVVVSPIMGGDATISRRAGSSWHDEPVDTMEGCSFEAFYAYEDRAMLTTRCGSNDRWLLTQIGDRWSMSAMWVPPISQMSLIAGAFDAGDSHVFYGHSANASETNALYATDIDVDLGYTPEVARWADGSSLADVVALEGDALHVLTGSEWRSIPCPVSLPTSDWITCWHSGTRSDSGDVFLGGGTGSSGDSGSDDQRLHWWDGETLRQILDPCGGSNPSCGIEDLATTADRLYVLVRQDWSTSLFWTELPR